MIRKSTCWGLLLLVLYAAGGAVTVMAATGAPKILNYQGRLTDSSGTLLGGTGTAYCFRFSLYDNSMVGSGSKVWPSTAPSTMTVTVKNGTFSAGIGDTNAGGDLLDYNFQDSDAAYLNVDVATKVGPTCAAGDGAESYETLSPRQRLLSSGYALNSNTVGGFSAAQEAAGNQIAALTADKLILGGANAGISATSTNAFTIQGSGATGNINFFNTSNKLDSAGNLTLGGSLVVGNGLATSTLQSSVTGTSTVQGFLQVLGVNSTSTFSGGVSAAQLSIGTLTGILRATSGAVTASLVDLTVDITGVLPVANGGTGTSTAPGVGEVLVGNALGGFDYIAASTFADGTFSTTSAIYFADSSSTIAKTYTSNTFSVQQNFGNALIANASTTNISSTYASSTQGFFGSVVVGTLSGIVHAAGGALTAAAVNLASEVTGILGISNGGTGTSTTPALGQVLVGNTGGGFDYVATSTFGDGNFSTTSANFYAHSSTTIPKTYTVNTFSATQVFANASSTAFSVANGQSTTTLLGQATSTFGAGVQATALRVTGSATSSFGGAVDIASGCFSVNGTCIGSDPSATNVVLSAVRTGNSTTTWNVPVNLVYAVVELWGGGGGGGGGGTAGVTGTLGATTTFGGMATSSGGIGGGAGGAARAGGAGGAGSGGDVNLTGMPGIGGGVTTVSGAGGNAIRGGNGAVGVANAIATGNTGALYGGGGSGAGNTTAARTGAGGGGGGFTQETFTAAELAGTTTIQVGVGVGGTGGAGGGTGPSTGGAGGTGGYIIYEYTANNVNVGNGTVANGSTGQVAFYDTNGTSISGTSLISVDTANGRIGISSSTPMSVLSVVGDAIVTGQFTTGDIVATGTLSVLGQTTLGNASTTNISASYASSTQGFFGSAIIGTLSGIVHATGGLLSAAALNLASEVTGILSVVNGGTGWANLAAGTLLTGNGTGAIATSTVDSSLQLSGGSLALNLSNQNFWTGLQNYANASTSVSSVFSKAYFGGTATTTIDSAGNVSVAGTLGVAGTTTLATTTVSDLTSASSTVQKFFSPNATTTHATSTNLFVAATLNGAGLSACSGSSDKLLWNGATGQFSCGVDAGGGGGTGIVSLGEQGQYQTGTTQTFATSTDANIGLTITSASDTHTFTTIWNGVLSVLRGGTGWANIAAGTLLTGNGTGALATTTVGSSLQLSGGSLGLNLSNPNTWSGLQQFGNASTSLVESLQQFARTIQSTSTNALVFKTNLTSSAGLTIGGTTTAQMITLDTLNGRVRIGPGGTATPTQFVLDTKNTAGDPPVASSTDGAMYYNSTDGLYRCFAGGVWRTCGGQAASSTGDVQFKQADGSFGADDDFQWSVSNHGLTIIGNPGQSTSLLTVASSTGSPVFSVAGNGVLRLATTTDPATPSTGLDIYAKDIAGRILPKWVGPAGVDTPFQANLGFNRVAILMPAGGATCSTAVGGFGTTFVTNAGTCANPTPATTNFKNATVRTTFSSGTTAGTVSYSRPGRLQVWRGNVAGQGGFFFTIRFGLNTLQSGNRAFVGLTDTAANPTNIDPTTSTAPGKVGMAINTNTGNWQFVNNVTGSAPTDTDLGSSFPVNNTDLFELILYSPPNGSSINYRITDLSTGAQTTGSVSSNLPSNTTFLAPLFWITNNATAAAAIMDFGGWYLESDQ